MQNIKVGDQVRIIMAGNYCGFGIVQDVSQYPTIKYHPWRGALHYAYTSGTSIPMERDASKLAVIPADHICQGCALCLNRAGCIERGISPTVL